MKKGFTLVELLAVIVILAVILVIAIPQVLKVVDNSRTKAYIKNEQMIANVAKTYLASNSGKAPVNEGHITIVSLSELQENNLIGDIKDVSDKQTICTGYVLIINIGNDEYDYQPFLDCSGNYQTEGYVEDGLTVVEVFLVGGGGGGSSNLFAGGGAGGYVRSYFNILVEQKNKWPTIVGAGGDAGTHRGGPDGSRVVATSGEYSRFGFDDTYQAEGGNAATSTNGANGGSGGGGGSSGLSTGTGGDGGFDGNDGEASEFNHNAGGIGQGFSTREFNQVFNENTGEWETIDSNSTATLYAGGGGGGGRSYGDGGVGGSGGGGTANGLNGIDGLCGGGAGHNFSAGWGGSGGSGIVIVRYQGERKANGGEITTEGEYTYHRFTEVGESTFEILQF